MSTPTLINGFEDIVNFIKQQEHRIQKLQEENKGLKQRNESLSKKLHEYSESENIKKLEQELQKTNSGWSQMEEKLEDLQEENKELKEENDDLKGRLEDVNHTAEQEESIPLKRKILIQDYIIKNMLYKLLCDSEEAEIEIPKKWRVDGVDSFTLEYSDIMEKVCKEMDEDDWNDDGSNLTLDWHNDTLEVVECLFDPE